MISNNCPLRRDVFIGGHDGGGTGTNAPNENITGTWLSGGDGNDLLFDGAGHDRLHGSAGDDILTGGAGTDTFVFYGSNFGNDTLSVLNFGEGHAIALSDGITNHRITSLADIEAYATLFGGPTAVSSVTISTTLGTDKIRLVGPSI